MSVDQGKCGWFPAPCGIHVWKSSRASKSGCTCAYLCHRLSPFSPFCYPALTPTSSSLAKLLLLILRAFELEWIWKKVKTKDKHAFLWSQLGWSLMRPVLSVLSLNSSLLCFRLYQSFLHESRDVSAFTDLNNFLWHIEVGLWTEAANNKCKPILEAVPFFWIRNKKWKWKKKESQKGSSCFAGGPDTCIILIRGLVSVLWWWHWFPAAWWGFPLWKGNLSVLA